MNAKRLMIYRLKYLITRPAFVALLAFIPLCLLSASRFNPAGAEESIRVGYYCEDEELSAAISSASSLYDFVPFRSETALRRALAVDDLECGYIISASVLEDIVNNRADKDILVLTKETSGLVPLLNELLFSVIFEEAAPLILEQYIEEDSPYLLAASPVKLSSMYEGYLSSGYVYAFEYENEPISYKNIRNSIWQNPLRGLIALLLLFAGFTGLLSYKRTCSAHPVLVSTKLKLVYCLAPMLLCLIPIILCYALTPGLIGTMAMAPSIIKEPAKLLLYQFLCLCFLSILDRLIGKTTVLYAFMPVYLMCCLIFSPILIDAGSFIPALKALKYLFLPTYYLIF